MCVVPEKKDGGLERERTPPKEQHYGRRGGDPRALSSQLELLEGQIPAPLKEFRPFVPMVPTPAFRGRSVPGEGWGQAQGQHHSPACSSGTRRSGFISRSSVGARIHVQPRPPVCPQGKAANPVTPGKAVPREKRGSTEEPRKAEGVRPLPAPGRQMRANERESERRGAGGGERGRGRERRAPRSERTRPPLGPRRRREKEGAGGKGRGGGVQFGPGVVS